MDRADFDALHDGDAVLYHEGAAPYRLQPGIVLRRPLLQSTTSLIGIALPEVGRIVYPAPGYVHRPRAAPSQPCPFCQPTPDP